LPKTIIDCASLLLAVQDFALYLHYTCNKKKIEKRKLPAKQYTPTNVVAFTRQRQKILYLYQIELK